jgi:hypothetical protein
MSDPEIKQERQRGKRAGRPRGQCLASCLGHCLSPAFAGTTLDDTTYAFGQSMEGQPARLSIEGLGIAVAPTWRLAAKPLPVLDISIGYINLPMGWGQITF